MKKNKQRSLAKLSRTEMELLAWRLISRLRPRDPAVVYFTLWGEWRRAKMAIITMYREVGLTPPTFTMDNEIPTIAPFWLDEEGTNSQSTLSNTHEIISAVREVVDEMHLTGGSEVRCFDLYSAMMKGR